MTRYEQSQLIPVPQRVSRTTGFSQATDHSWVILVRGKELDPRLLPILRLCIQTWSDLLGHKLQPRFSDLAEKAEEDSFLWLLPTDPGLPDGGYSLVIERDRITLTGADAEGSFRGLMSLERLLRLQGRRLECCRLLDYPGFAQRGVMLDISRCKVPKLQTLKRLVERLAAFGINQLQLYTEHTFAYTQHRRVWADASPMTASDLLELDRHCAAYFVELVPNQNSFGHMERWLQHPEYHRFAECPAGFDHPLGGRREFGSTLRPDDISLHLLGELYDELLPCFRSTQFNIGGDEPWELGEGRSRRRCEQQGIGKVYVDFLSRVHGLVQDRDHTTQFWSDIMLNYPDCIAALDRQMIALNWGYEADHPFEQEGRTIRQSGLDYYVCPGTSSWNSLTGRSTNLWGNLVAAARAGQQNEALGFLITDWGDGGHHQYLPIAYPGLALGAALAWNPASAENLRVESAINSLLGLAEEDAAGGLLWELGKVADDVDTAPLRNAGLFDRLLFGNHAPGTESARLAADVSDVQAGRLKEQLAYLAGQCDSLRGDCQEETQIMQAEVRNAIRLAELGLARRAIGLASGRTRALLLSDTRERLAESIASHETLWLARNRIGGLHESSARLRRVLQQLGDAS